METISTVWSEDRLERWIHETGSTTAYRLEITEQAASVHVWVSQIPEQMEDLTDTEVRWRMRNRQQCGVCFTMRSSNGGCNCDG